MEEEAAVERKIVRIVVRVPIIGEKYDAVQAHPFR
jgi:hypothetical protein